VELAGLEPAASWVRFGRPIRSNSADLQALLANTAWFGLVRIPYVCRRFTGVKATELLLWPKRRRAGTGRGGVASRRLDEGAPPAKRWAHRPHASAVGSPPAPGLPNATERVRGDAASLPRTRALPGAHGRAAAEHASAPVDEQHSRPALLLVVRSERRLRLRADAPLMGKRHSSWTPTPWTMERIFSVLRTSASATPTDRCRPR
jgi:hypothetical protein